MKQKAKSICLGEGEVIGHKHVLSSNRDIVYEKVVLEPRNFESISFMLSSMGVLTHDEHDRIVFEKGTYRSYNQVEFNPLNNSISRVFD